MGMFRDGPHSDFLGLLFVFCFCGGRIVALSSSSSQLATPRKVEKCENTGLRRNTGVRKQEIHGKS
ncbi:hypothetical protein H5410_030065 [Solanum commersonii]|uniref:Secreted protein n=1 Tax=Solanum commersonii TaxID=4109 RepID=A0A9J5YFU3_SOLCO|nr:hypothetical protein H5410_030065 [Solanum commersonii]